MGDRRLVPLTVGRRISSLSRRPHREANEDQDQPDQDEVHLVLPSAQQRHARRGEQSLYVIAPSREQVEFELERIAVAGSSRHRSRSGVVENQRSLVFARTLILEPGGERMSSDVEGETLGAASLFHFNLRSKVEAWNSGWPLLVLVMCSEGKTRSLVLGRPRKTRCASGGKGVR